MENVTLSLAHNVYEAHSNETRFWLAKYFTLAKYFGYFQI